MLLYGLKRGDIEWKEIKMFAVVTGPVMMLT